MATMTHGRAALNVPAAGMHWRSASVRRVALETVAALAAVSREMSFVEHLEELRRRLIWSIGFVAVANGTALLP